MIVGTRDVLVMVKAVVIAEVYNGLGMFWSSFSWRGIACTAGWIEWMGDSDLQLLKHQRHSH